MDLLLAGWLVDAEKGYGASKAIFLLKTKCEMVADKSGLIALNEKRFRDSPHLPACLLSKRTHQYSSC